MGLYRASSFFCFTTSLCQAMTTRFFVRDSRHARSANGKGRWHSITSASFAIRRNSRKKEKETGQEATVRQLLHRVTGTPSQTSRTPLPLGWHTSTETSARSFSPWDTCCITVSMPPMWGG